MNHYKRIEQAILFIEESSARQPSLQEVADHVGLSVFHFQRLFRRWAGISPKRYIQFLTAKHCADLLRAPTQSCTLDAALDAGLSGTGRLHDLMVNVYAMTPEAYRRHGQAIRIEYGWHHTPFGLCLLARTDKGVCWLSFHEKKDGMGELKNEWKDASYVENPKSTAPLIRQIFTRIYDRPQSIMLHVKGTNLQIRVWEALLSIPRSERVTYSQIAAAVEHPRAVRAVANAVGRNPISYIIPCHRVIRMSGALGGYRWGLPRKQVMQAWESAQLIDPDDPSAIEISPERQLFSAPL